MDALLTLLAVGIHPTVQQSIAIRTRNEVNVRQAHIPRAQSFIQWTFASLRGGGIVPTASMVGSLYSGMFFSSTRTGKASLDTVPGCPIGNCTLPA
jgi:hypothetical protein